MSFLILHPREIQSLWSQSTLCQSTNETSTTATATITITATKTATTTTAATTVLPATHLGASPHPKNSERFHVYQVHIIPSKRLPSHKCPAFVHFAFILILLFAFLCLPFFSLSVCCCCCHINSSLQRSPWSQDRLQ